TIRFWDLMTGKEIRSVRVGGVFVYHLKMSSDGKYFAAHVDRQGLVSRSLSEHQSIFLGEVASGKILREFEENFIGFRQVQFTADGKRLAAVQGGGLAFAQSEKPVKAKIWDAEGGKELRSFDDVLAFALAPDGDHVAVGRTDGIVTVLQISTGKET